MKREREILLIYAERLSRDAIENRLLKRTVLETVT